MSETPSPRSEPQSALPAEQPPVDQVSGVDSASPDAPRHRARPAWLLPFATGVVGFVLGVAGTAVVTAQRDAASARAVAAASASAASASASEASTQAAVLTDAVRTCGLTGSTGIELGDGGASLTFDMKGKDDLSGAHVESINCLFGKLDMPSAVSSHMNQTTSMDGRQTESWGNLTISWSYHPDRGLDGVLTIAEK
ncbi:MAG: hypothetical protein L6367_10655 [Cellulomonas sp.]|nr:hypothetical protein [Cellulomonas sp.]